MSGPRVAVVSDLREEQWHSMDLVSELLLAGLRRVGTVGQPSRACRTLPADDASAEPLADRGRIPHRGHDATA